MSAGDAWYLPARAKLNLQLQVVGRRADGYHLLRTLFHTLQLHDDLWLRARAEPGVSLRVTADAPDLLAPAGADNLVVRALDAFSRGRGLAAGFEVLLHKRIPSGGGLGGGSSDAAAALRLAAVACGGATDGAELHALAVPLGADVPFFLGGGSQWAGGIGDELSPATVPSRHFVLLLPPYGCPTAHVYKMFAAQWNGPCHGDSVDPSTVSEKSDAAERMGFYNALSSAAERVQPALADLRRRVATLGFPQVSMTGSGSTLFVAVAGAKAAAQAARQLGEALAELQVRVVTTCSGPDSESPRRVPELGAAVALHAPHAPDLGALDRDGREGRRTT